MKAFATFIFLAVIMLHCAFAQTAPYDSVKIKRTARRDARKFRLNSDDRKKFRAENFPSMSDHFKPTAASASNPELLNDSLYVQTYREIAFFRTVTGHTRTLHDMLPKPPWLRDDAPGHTTSIEKTARRDADAFNLDKKQIKKFRAGHLPNTSDYFKPTASYASDPALLNDSSYVKAFRTAAFYRTLYKGPPAGVVALIVGVSVAGTIATFLVLLHIFKVY